MNAHIAQMANDIAASHQSYGGDEAELLVAEHFNKFWAPSMRQKLFETFQRDPSSFNALIARSLPRINCQEYNPHTEEIHDKEGTGG